LELEIPRDRQSSFDPQLIAKYQRRFPGFDDKIISMYARGMSNREIVGHLRDLYGIDVSPDLISGERPVSRFCLGARLAQVTSQMIHL
jgi:putative transposase